MVWWIHRDCGQGSQLLALSLLALQRLIGVVYCGLYCSVMYLAWQMHVQQICGDANMLCGFGSIDPAAVSL